MTLAEDEIKDIWIQVYLKTVELGMVDVGQGRLSVIDTLNLAREEADRVIKHLQSTKTT
jgi:hypothetical protein